ncbi:MAG: hypothetical protein IPQ07_25280 [Myxococcales bacterium]|nr:hypothetical protein [Myxococcales bacterium]
MKLPGLCLALLITGCGTTSFDVATTPLAGTVGGQPWSFVAGQTNAFLSEGDNDFFTTMYPAAYTTCGFSEPGGTHLIVSVPKAVGDYDMGTQRNMTFVVGSDNKVAFDGRIIVDEVTATKVVGGLHGSFDGDNEVDGRFEVSICAN